MSWASDLWHSTTDVIGDVWDDVTDVMVDTIPAATTIIGGIVGGPVGAAAGYGLGDALGDIGSGVESYLNKEAAKDQLEDEQEFNASEAQLNRNFQREERLQTQQFNLDMWNKNNEYNSPAAQIERAKAAGVNPNIAVESLSRSSANPVTSSPMSGSLASSPGSLASAMLLQSAQIANLNAQTRKANTEANNNEQEYAYNNVIFSDRVKALKYANEETKARLNKIVADTKLQEQLYEFLAHKNEEELNQLRLLCDKTSAEINNLKKQGNIIDKQGQLIDQQVEGAKYDNTLKGIQVAFSKSSGIPQGTDWSEAFWKTVVNGDAGDLIDIFITNVEDVALGQAKRWAKRGFNAFDLGKKGIKAAGSMIDSFFGGVTPPKSVYNP